MKVTLLVSRELSLTSSCCLYFCFDIFIPFNNIFKLCFKNGNFQKDVNRNFKRKGRKGSGPNKLEKYQFDPVVYKFTDWFIYCWVS